MSTPLSRDHFFTQSCAQCSTAPFLKYFRKCKSSHSEKQMRIVVPNHAVQLNINDRHHPNHSYRTNKIRTTKYTVLSFLPKNIFEQFHRFANLYFLSIVILNWIIKAFGREVSIIPLGFVLGVTAVKDAFEDWRRYRSDKRVNSYTCRVYKREAGRYMKTQWNNVRVGDIVHLSCNEIIPADILLLRSSDIQGLCYIETANIDGETNLKQRQVARGATTKHTSFHPTDFSKSIECEPPNNKIYKFHGCILSPEGEQTSITKQNLLLRDCVLKNTDFIEGIVLYAGHETKAMLNNGGPRYKRSKLEKIMNSHILGCIAILVVLCLVGALGCGLWFWMYGESTSVPFVPNEGVPPSAVHQGAYSILTFIIILQVIIPLSLYVTVEIIKLGQVFFIHEDLELYDEKSNKRVECRALNIPEELGQVQYIFSDKTGTLTENFMIFRQCTIGGVDFTHLSSSKGDQNSDVTTEVKESKDKFIVNPTLYEELCLMDMELHVDKDVRLQLSSDHKRIQDFFLLLAICNTVVVSKHPHKDQMNSSGLFLNLLSVNNELHVPGAGDVPHDKYVRLVNTVDTPTNSAASTPNWRPRHLPLPTFSAYNNSTPTPSPADFRPIYEAESPDEIALVEAAFQYNCRLLKRTPDTALIVLPGEGMVEFRVLHILPFDAVRKRMSIILQHPFTDEKILFCKGADSTVLTQLSSHATPEMQQIIMKTQQQLNGYSKKGLRILCMAKKVISPDEYDSWLVQHREAELTFEDQDELLHMSACRIETNLELLGATGIEDRLQSGVPETIAALRAAGIVLWVLTGDKQETAVNIAYSCKLFSSSMEIITINARSMETAEDTIKFYLDQINKDVITWNASNSSSTLAVLSAPAFKFLRKRSAKNKCISRLPSQASRQRALVIDGHTLTYILDKKLSPLFVELAVHCQSVLCCRATPLQKASIIKLVKESLHVLTLAIGDGANDVSMIQTADVGVGISGQEGMQAVMASDFALVRFRHMERLLLVHGHWCYDRLSRTILYFFYKNANLIFVLFWYQFFCGFTGAVMIDELYLMLVNVFFTSIPPIVLGMYDQDVIDHLLLQNPHLYARGRNSELYTKYSFIFNMLDAVYQSIVMFFIPFSSYYDSTVGIWEFGTTAGTACVVTQLIHLCIEIKSWTWIHIVSIIVSLLLYFGFAFAYSAVCVTCPGLQNPYWVVEHTMGTAVFWFNLLLIIPLSCFPRLIVHTLKNQFWPSDVVSAKLEHKAHKKYSEQSTLSVSWSRASSGSSIIINNGNHGEVQEGNIQQSVTTMPTTLNSDDHQESPSIFNSHDHQESPQDTVIA